MNGNVELLNYIYQNSEMGQDTIKQLMGMVEDDAFKKTLDYQYNEYKKIFDVSDSKLKQVHGEGKGINVLTKASTYIMINLRTLVNRSSSHISEMLIQGSTMGIIDITKKLKEYKDADKEILDLGNRLMQFEQRSIKELKKFL